VFWYAETETSGEQPPGGSCYGVINVATDFVRTYIAAQFSDISRSPIEAHVKKGPAAMSIKIADVMPNWGDLGKGKFRTLQKAGKSAGIMLFPERV
jgi:hypothetical protein